MSRSLEPITREQKKHNQDQRAGRVWRKLSKVKLEEQEKTNELREWIASD